MKFINCKCENRESGAITIVETLIALSIGTALLLVWAQSKLDQMEVESARNAGRSIAAYARAASVWLAENPPDSEGTYSISSLQDCSTPNGRRYLSCTYDANTSIPYIRNSAGTPLTFGDLEINVSLYANTPRGLIDFGVFRHGTDSNGDDLPDARPDLAAAAFTTAVEETGAGVMEFFELNFARNSAAGLVFDPKDPAYNLADVEDLARLQARIGAVDGSTPFLRVDGGNKMEGAITFDNGMLVGMVGNDLALQGPGEIRVETDTGTLRVETRVETEFLDAVNVSANDVVTDTFEALTSLTVEPVDGVLGQGFDRFNQRPDIMRMNDEITLLSDEIDTNRDDINQNVFAIRANLNEINAVRNIASHSHNHLHSYDYAHKDHSHDNSVPTSCLPTKSSLVSNMKAKGYTKNSEDHTYCKLSASYNPACGKIVLNPSAGLLETYETREISTLACNSNSIKFYQSCCFVANGNCDGLYGQNICS